MSGGEVMFHYTLSTCHTEKTPVHRQNCSAHEIKDLRSA